MYSGGSSRSGRRLTKGRDVVTKFASSFLFATALLWLSLLVGHGVGAQEAAPLKQAAEAPTPAAVRDYVNILTESARRFEAAAQRESDAIEKAAQRESVAIDNTLNKFIWIVGIVGALLLAGGGLLAWFLAQWNEHWIKREAEQQVKSRIANAIDEEVKRVLENSGLEDQLDLIRTDTVPAAAARAEPSPVPSGATPGYIGKKIVWVDDQPRTIEAACDELVRKGIKVTTLESTDALEAQLKSAKFNLIVSDMRREGNPRAGLDYYKKIRDRDDLPPRLLFAPKSLIDRYRPEINDLISNTPPGRYLPPVTSNQEFFTTVLKVLG